MKITLYRHTHRYALAFCTLVSLSAGSAVAWMNDTVASDAAAQAPTLGRFIVSSHASRFVSAPPRATH